MKQALNDLTQVFNHIPPPFFRALHFSLSLKDLSLKEW
jgi:hypothetical protein